jgi:two-component system, LytTR family, response regulator
MKTLRCLVIDDEPMACKGLAEYIGEVSSLQLVATVNRAADAVKYLPETDVMFLDINMPDVTGIDFLKHIPNPPLTIITTAYQEYALQGYELNVVDYLLKPIAFERFLKACQKATDYMALTQHENNSKTTVTPAGYFFVKTNGVLEKVMLSSIVAVEGLTNYITIHCTDKKIVTYLTLKQILENLPGEMFMQVHKSFIVSLDKIDQIDHDEIVTGKLRVPVGQNYKAVLNSRLLNGKVLKR